MPSPAVGLLLRSRASTYAQKVQGLLAGHLVAYWQMAEPSGSISLDSSGNGHNGAYTGVTLAQPGVPGAGTTAASFDGSTSFNNVYSPGLAAAFNSSELTFGLWFYATAWANDFHNIFELGVDSANYFRAYRFVSGTNMMSFDFNGTGTTKSSNSFVVPLNAWNHVMWTVSKTGDQLICYKNGSAVGSPVTGLPTISGSLASTLAVIGARNTSASNPFPGTLAHAVLCNVALPAATIAQLAVAP